MAQAVCIPTTTESDDLLLALCQRADVLGKAIDRINAAEPDEARAEEQTAPLYEELGTIQTAIVGLRAHTLAGVIAKAKRVVWCRAGDMSGEMDDPLTMSIVRDLLKTEAA